MPFALSPAQLLFIVGSLCLAGAVTRLVIDGRLRTAGRIWLACAALVYALSFYLW